MLAPGVVISSGRVDITASAGQVPDFFHQGVGFMDDGSIAIDTDAPTGTDFRAGVRQSAAGAFYGTTSTAGTDVWIGGLRTSVAGALVYEAAAATGAVNGNPLTANGRLATI